MSYYKKMDSLNFVDTLKDLLIENNLMQKDLAEKLNISSSAVTRYLSGQQNPEIDIAVKTADYFNCTLDYLFGLEENNAEKTFHAYPEFKTRFKFLLKHFNKKIKEIEDNTDIGKSIMYYWLNGKRTPSIDSIINLAKYFNCSMDFVIGRVDFE